jgi:hypothetical protein
MLRSGKAVNPLNDVCLGLKYPDKPYKDFILKASIIGNKKRPVVDSRSRQAWGLVGGRNWHSASSLLLLVFLSANPLPVFNLKTWRLVNISKRREKKMKEGIYVQNLKKGDVVEVETKNHIYTLEVIDPKKRLVKINGGIFSEPTIRHFDGSLYAPHTGWIGVGYSLLFEGGLLFTITQTISVNGKKVFPKE